MRKKPPAWKETPETYRNLLTHEGLVDVKEWYFDESMMGHGMDRATVFSKDSVQGLGEQISFHLSLAHITYFIKHLSVDNWKKRTQKDKYKNCSALTDEVCANCISSALSLYFLNPYPNIVPNIRIKGATLCLVNVANSLIGTRP